MQQDFGNLVGRNQNARLHLGQSWPAVTGAGCWQAGCENSQGNVHIHYSTRATEKI